jgi:hypothetical protein
MVSPPFELLMIFRERLIVLILAEGQATRCLLSRSRASFLQCLAMRSRNLRSSSSLVCAAYHSDWRACSRHSVTVGDMALDLCSILDKTHAPILVAGCDAKNAQTSGALSVAKCSGQNTSRFASYDNCVNADARLVLPRSDWCEYAYRAGRQVGSRALRASCKGPRATCCAAQGAKACCSWR